MSLGPSTATLGGTQKGKTEMLDWHIEQENLYREGFPRHNSSSIPTSLLLGKEWL